MTSKLNVFIHEELQLLLLWDIEVMEMLLDNEKSRRSAYVRNKVSMSHLLCLPHTLSLSLSELV